MLSKIQQFIDQNKLLNRDQLHLVGLSGGADSVALLLILQKLGYQIEAAHCNFCLRGDESLRDENFVRDLCARIQVPLHIVHFETKEFASLHHVSIEMAARELRYSYFCQLCKDIGATTVCIAHHRDDAVETLLMNLLRGAGIHGLTGIRPKNNMVRRPLLCVDRHQIIQYLDSIGQSYVVDSTNLEADVLRNKLRLRVLPLLEEIVPGAAACIDKTASYMRQAEKVYQAEIARELTGSGVQNNGRTSLTVSIDYLLQLPSPSSFLHEWLLPFGFNAAQTEQLLDCIGDTGRQFMSSTHILVVDRQQLVLESVGKPLITLRVPECGTYRYTEHVTFKFEISSNITISRKSYVATVDAQRVQFPLTLRPVEKGDRFYPYGMRGSKLVSDYLTDLKLSVLEKKRQLALVDASAAIVWIVGRRTDNRFCVTNETKQVLRITFDCES